MTRFVPSFPGVVSEGTARFQVVYSEAIGEEGAFNPRLGLRVQ